MAKRARVRLPDGSIATLRVPDDATRGEIQQRARRMFNAGDFQRFGTQERPQFTPEVSSGQLQSQIESLPNAAQFERGRQAARDINPVSAASINILRGVPGTGGVAESALRFADPDSSSEEVEAFTEGFAFGLDERSDFSSALGQGTGVILSGVGAGRAIQGGGRALAGIRGGGRAAEAGRRTGRAIQFQEGQAAANTARAAGEGAAIGGGFAAAEGGSAGRGAGVGAVADVFTRGLTRIIPAAGRFFGREAGTRRQGARVLRGEAEEASPGSVDPDRLAREGARFRETFGENPTILETLPQPAGRRAGLVGGVRPEAGRRLDEAAERTRRAAPNRAQRALPQGRTATEETVPEITPRRFGQQLRGNRVRLDVEGAQNRRTASVNQQFEAIERANLDPSDDLVDFLNNPDVRAAFRGLPRTEARRISNFLDEQNAIRSGNEPPELSAGEEAFVTVRDLENIRQVLSEGGTRPGSGSLRGLSQEARQITGRQFPEAERALAEFGRRGDVIQGIEAGRRVSQPGSADELARLRETGTPSQRAGARVGARSELEDLTGDTSESAARLADRIVNDSGFRQRLQQVLPAREFAQIGRAANRLIRNRRLAEGLRLGRSVTRPQSATGFSERVAQASRSEREGIETGVRTGLREETQTPQRVEALFRQLDEDAGLINRLEETLGPTETRAAQEAGQIGRRAGETTQAARPGNISEAAGGFGEAPIGIQAAALLTNRFGSGFLSNFARSIETRLRVPPRAAQRTAELLTDPDRFEEGIALLRRVNADDQRVAQIVADAGRASAADAGVDFTNAAPEVAQALAGLGIFAGRGAVNTVSGFFEEEEQQ